MYQDLEKKIAVFNLNSEIFMFCFNPPSRYATADEKDTV